MSLPETCLTGTAECQCEDTALLVSQTKPVALRLFGSAWDDNSSALRAVPASGFFFFLFAVGLFQVNYWLFPAKFD